MQETKEQQWRQKVKDEVRRFVERVEFLVRTTDPFQLIQLPTERCSQKALVEMYLAAYRWQLLEAIGLEYLLLSLNLRLDDDKPIHVEEVPQGCP